MTTPGDFGSASTLCNHLRDILGSHAGRDDTRRLRVTARESKKLRLGQAPPPTPPAPELTGTFSRRPIAGKWPQPPVEG